MICLPPRTVSWVAKREIETAIGIDFKVFPLYQTMVLWKGTGALILAKYAFVTLSEVK